MAAEYLNIVTYPYQRIIAENVRHRDVSLKMLRDEFAGEFEGPCPCADEDKGCSSPSSCIFRAGYAECNIECSKSCSNKDIQRKNWWKGLYIKDTPNFGLGVFTKMPIPPFKFICEFVGELVTNNEFQRRRERDYAHFTHHYAMKLKENIVIDSYIMCGIASFVNSSCRPNCETRRIIVNGNSRMTLWSLNKTIGVDEQLTYTYNFDNDLPVPEFECACGEDCCVSLKAKKESIPKPSTSTMMHLNSKSQIFPLDATSTVHQNMQQDESQMENEIGWRGIKRKSKPLVITDDEDENDEDNDNYGDFTTSNQQSQCQDISSSSSFSSLSFSGSSSSSSHTVPLYKTSPSPGKCMTAKEDSDEDMMSNLDEGIVMKKMKPTVMAICDDVNDDDKNQTFSADEKEGINISSEYGKKAFTQPGHNILSKNTHQDATKNSSFKSEMDTAKAESKSTDKPKIWKELRRGSEIILLSDDDDDFEYFYC